VRRRNQSLAVKSLDVAKRGAHREEVLLVSQAHMYEIDEAKPRRGAECMEECARAKPHKNLANDK
jgi:hypothetical protein